MPSRAVTLHEYKKTKDTGVKTTGGLTGKKLMVSPVSGEVVDKAKRRQGLKSTWAKDTELCRKELKIEGMVLFNVGPIGKKLYMCVKDKQAARVLVAAKK